MDVINAALLRVKSDRVLNKNLRSWYMYNQSFSQMIDIFIYFPFWISTIVFIHMKGKKTRTPGKKYKTNNLFVDDSNAFSTVFEFKTSVHRSPLNSSCYLFHVFCLLQNIYNRYILNWNQILTASVKVDTTHRIHFYMDVTESTFMFVHALHLPLRAFKFEQH